MGKRGARMLEAMIAAAPVPLKVRRTFVGDCDVLMTYGTGHPVRRPWWKKQRAIGGRCIGWDLGYWKLKADGTYRMRVTVDDDHPHRLIRPEPPERWDAEGIALREDAGPGPIVLIGLTAKSNHAAGLPTLHWERKKLREIEKLYPGRAVVHRPKRPTDPLLRQVRIAEGGPIEPVLKGASLVVCKHSNVAVDACIAGVPVVCEDGAARALYGSDLSAPKVPTREERLAFLRGLAWWQWKPEEAKDAWTYLLQRLSA
jgi:hypothetical protein